MALIDHQHGLVLMFAFILNIHTDEARHINITADEIHTATVHPDEHVVFQLYHVPSKTSFIVFQVHTQVESLGLSLTPEFQYGSFVSGNDIGVVTEFNSTGLMSTPVSWFMRTNGTKYASSFEVLVLAKSYIEDDPVPGGCNMEFPLAMDPNLHISYEHHSTLVSFQYGHQGPLSYTECKPQTRLEYTIYQRYLRDNTEEEYNKAVKDMLLVKGINAQANKLKKFGSSDRTQQRFSAYTGKGVAYNVIVTDKLTRRSSAYIPIINYGCPVNERPCERDLFHDVYGMLLVIALGVFGLFMCFLGHRFLKTELFLFGFIGFLLVAFILLLRFTSLSEQACLAIASVCGAVGGSLCLAFWYYKGIPILSVLFVGLVSGYLVSSIVFNLTPLKDMIWWQQSVTYGLSFVCGIVIIPVLLLIFTKTLNILSCSLVGGYLAVLVVDIFLHGNISQIVMVSVRKATWDGFMNAIITYPYQLSDLLLVIAWLILAVGGAILQFVRERNRAPFPPCPWHLRQLDLQHAAWSADMLTSNAESTNHVTSPYDSEDGENTPLLNNRH